MTMGFKDTINWYDRNAAEYANAAEKVLLREVIEKFFSMLPPSPRILDAGCGSGRDSRAMREKDAHVTGLDISHGLLEEAKKRSKNNDIDFVQGDMTQMPFENSLFDGVWSHASLVHLEKQEDVQNSLSEFNRVLKSGGALHIFVKMQQGKEETAVVADKVSNHDRFFRYYTEEKLRSQVSQAGFTDIDITKVPDPHGREEVTWLKLFAKKR